jgi:hypothetical protein
MRLIVPLLRLGSESASCRKKQDCWDAKLSGPEVVDEAVLPSFVGIRRGASILPLLKGKPILFSKAKEGTEAERNV